MRRGSTSLRPETIISIVSSPVPGVHIMWSRAQTKVSRKKARKWRKREKFPTSLLPGFFSPLQLFLPTLPYLNALNRLTFQSMIINRAYFILWIFWQVIYSQQQLRANVKIVSFFFSELNPCTNKESDNFEKLSPVFLKSFQHVYPKVTPKVRLMAGPLIRVPLKNEPILTQFILFLSFLSD